MKKDYVLAIDRQGNAIVGVEVYVRQQSDNNLVQLYSDDGVTTTANPMVTNNDGQAFFWTANNVLKFELVRDGVTIQTMTDVQHFDIDSISPFGYSLIDDADAAEALDTLGISAFVQTLLDDANGGAFLTTLGVSAFAQTLLDDADAPAARTTLGLGTAATAASTSFAPSVLTVEAETGASYTFVLGDAGKHKRFTNAGAVTVTVPPNASVAFSTGTRIRGTAAGAGGTTLAPGAGVTLNSRDGGLSSAGQFAVWEIEKVGTNEWDVLGDVA